MGQQTYRRPLITGFKNELCGYITSSIIQQGGIVFSVKGVPDYIHIALKIPPTHRVSDMVRIIKARSAKWVNDERKCATYLSWQRGYGAFTMSKSVVDTVVRYSNRQEEHHRDNTFKGE